MYFSIKEPVGRETAVIVEVPHAGTWIDPPSLWTLAAPARSIGRDADLYVDALYDEAPGLGATCLVAHVSRYVCDLNRDERDIDVRAAQGVPARNSPHGLIWCTTTDDQPALYAPLARGELNRRLEEIYRPYHRALYRLLQQKLEKFGFAILLCGHSMPSMGRAGHGDPGVPRAAVVPGSRGRTTAAAEVIRAPELLALQRGWSVRHDDPYRGGFTTAHYGRPRDGVHAVQVELARHLYMDEEGLTIKSSDFNAVRSYCTELVAHLGTLSPRGATDTIS